MKQKIKKANLCKNLINLKTGAFRFGKQNYIFANTTPEELQLMEETIYSQFKSSTMGIQNFCFVSREIDGCLFRISTHFNFSKLSMIFVDFEDGKQLLETELWNSLKQVKTNKQTKKGDISKAKNFEWGRIYAFYAQKINLGQFHIAYK